jgi:hypothetical protein
VRTAALTARYLLGGRRVDRGDQVSLGVGLIVQRRTRRAQTGILVQPQHLSIFKSLIFYNTMSMDFRLQHFHKIWDTSKRYFSRYAHKLSGEISNLLIRKIKSVCSSGSSLIGLTSVEIMHTSHGVASEVKNYTPVDGKPAPKFRAFAEWLRGSHVVAGCFHLQPIKCYN